MGILSYILSSSSRSSVNYKGRRYEKYGIPKRCFCSGVVKVATCHSPENPGRRYYTCKSEDDGGLHIFKWVDEAMMDELADVKDGIEGLNDRMRYVSKENKRIHSTCADLARIETMRQNLKDALDEIAHLNDLFVEHDEAIDKLKEVKECTRKNAVKGKSVKIGVSVCVVVLVVVVLIYLFK